MNQSYQVTYDLTTEPRNEWSGSYSSRSDLSNLTIVVQAPGASQARQIVESMFGGPGTCVAKNAILLG